MTNVAMLQTAADLSASITAQGVSSLVPAGVVMAYAGATAPTGWLLCNGALVSRTTYANLFSALSTAHGSGDGSSTFALPDYRGRFIRGRDTMGTAASREADKALRSAAQAGGATGDAVGSVQSYATGNLTTATNKSTTGLGGSANNGGIDHNHGYLKYSSKQQVNGGSFHDVWNYDANGTTGNSSAYLHTHPLSITADTETRPLNAYVNYIIKI